MHNNLAKIMPHVFQEEGGYVDHPADPGGATNLGITIGTLRQWRGRPVTKADVKALGRDEATKIYEANYARPIRFDALPSGVDYCVLDFAINSGPSRAAKYLQKVVGVPQDGIIGPVTLAAVRKMAPEDVVNKLCNARLAFLKGLGTWATFGKGWAKRVERVRSRSLDLVMPLATPAPLPPDVPKPKPQPPKPIPKIEDSNFWAGILAMAGVAIAALVGIVVEWMK